MSRQGGFDACDYCECEGCLQVMNASWLATVSHASPGEPGPSLEKASTPGKLHFLPIWIFDEGNNFFRVFRLMRAESLEYRKHVVWKIV
jgi:hypothetical protein